MHTASSLDLASGNTLSNLKILFSESEPKLVYVVLLLSIFIISISIVGFRFSASYSISDELNSRLPQIDSIGNRTLVVWQDNSTGNNEVYLRESTEGKNISRTVNLSNNTGSSEFPQIDSIGNRTLVVWQDNRYGK